MTTSHRTQASSAHRPKTAGAMDEQRFGAAPESVRETDHYQQEYIEQFADRWDRLIDWEARAQAEGDFYIRILREHGVKSVLDVATGTGFHSIRLLQEGFDVVSADGSPNMLARAFRNARDRDQLLRTAQADWRFLNRDIHGTFDAVICLGNSFTSKPTWLRLLSIVGHMQASREVSVGFSQPSFLGLSSPNKWSF